MTDNLTGKTCVKSLSLIIDDFRGKIPTGDEILEQEDIVKLKRCIYSAQVNPIANSLLWNKRQWPHRIAGPFLMIQFSHYGIGMYDPGCVYV